MGYYRVKNMEVIPNMSSLTYSSTTSDYFILRYEYKAGMKGDYISKTERGIRMIASREFKKDKKLIWEKVT